MATNDKTPYTGTLESRLEGDLSKLRPADEVAAEMDALWPNPGTPPAEVEALIEELERLDLRQGYTGVTSDELAMRCLATLRTLTARIAELEGQVEQARIEGRCEILSAIDELKPHALKSAPIPKRAAAAKAERAKIVGELESEAAKLRKGAEPLHFGSDDDQLKAEDMEDLSRILDVAADHIEANGRDSE